MYIGKTYQDYEKAADKARFLYDCVCEYKGSAWFKNACTAERYANGDNDINRRKKAKMVKMVRTGNAGEVIRTGEMVDVPMNRIGTSIFGRLLTQRVQYLFQNGMNLDNDKKAVFGENIDREMERAAKYAEMHGECYLMWQMTKAACMKAASANELSGMFFLLDEITGERVFGVRFYQISPDRPMTMIIYDAAGFDTYIIDEGKPQFANRQGYKLRTITDAISARAVYEGYAELPFAVFKANDDAESVFGASIKSKIDAYDVITSDLCDNLERMEGIYWAIKNFGGTPDEARAMLAEIESLKVALTQSDTLADADMEAKPQSIEAPYQARQYAAKLLRDALYQDFMALDMDVLSGGSLTNVAIETAKADLDLACNELETQAFDCISDILRIIGRDDVYAEIGKYQRQSIANQQEKIESIYTTGLREDIPRRTALELTGLFEADVIEQILADMDAEETAGLSTADELDRIPQEDDEE